MREDMQRVIITRRRGNHGPRRYKHTDYARAWRRAHPAHEAMSMGRGSKGFDDHLQPLRRYLAKQVGRPWNDVWSDICRSNDARSVIGRHLRDHVVAYVRLTPVVQPWKVWCELFVDDAGVLQRVPAEERSRWRYRAPRPKPIEHLLADGPGAVLARLRGIWYRFEVDANLAGTPTGIAPEDLAQIMGRPVGILLRTKRQLGRRELGRHRLTNMAPSS